ncbi:MAG: DNA-binding protein [Acidobacteria bacterium]|nr:DNA-binding protein [Acidobacteriota bacterium]
MAQLIVRNVDPGVVRELKLRAARGGRSAEAEHRAILREAVGATSMRRGLKDLLQNMPDVGEDTDFQRPRDLGRRTRL